MNDVSQLRIVEENEKTVLINPSNTYWVRMPSKRFREHYSSMEGRTWLNSHLQEKFKLFDPGADSKSNLRTVYFSITGRCNLCCSFCSMNSSPQTSIEHDFTLEQIEEELIPNLLYPHIKKIVITGGEPMMRPDYIDILRLFAENFGKNRIVFQTNGLLLTLENVKEISRYVGIVEISIENIFSNKKLLERMLKIFKEIDKQGVTLSLSFVVDEESRPYLFKALDVCHYYGATLTTRVVSLIGRASKESRKDSHLVALNQLQLQYDVLTYLLDHDYMDEGLIGTYLLPLQARTACGAFGKILGIHPNGDVYMCSNFKDSRYSMGNLKVQSITDIIDELERKMQDPGYIKEFSVNEIPTCEDCEVKYFCSGSCPAETAENRDNPNIVSERCFSIQAMLRFSMFYYDKGKSKKDNLLQLKQFLHTILKGYNSR